MYLKIKNVFAPETKIMSQVKYSNLTYRYVCSWDCCTWADKQWRDWGTGAKLTINSTNFRHKYLLNSLFFFFKFPQSYFFSHEIWSPIIIFTIPYHESGDSWSNPEVHWLLGGRAAEGLHQAVPGHRPCKQAQGQGPPLPPCTIWGAGSFSLKYLGWQLFFGIFEVAVFPTCTIWGGNFSLQYLDEAFFPICAIWDSNFFFVKSIYSSGAFSKTTCSTHTCQKPR